MDRLRAVSAAERRSMNSEILVLLEEGVAERWARLERGGAAMSRPLQVALWKELAGGWDDDRTTEEIISDIRASRTGGREFSL